VNFDLWFTYFHSSHKSREPVNHGSQITQATQKLCMMRALRPDRVLYK